MWELTHPNQLRDCVYVCGMHAVCMLCKRVSEATIAFCTTQNKILNNNIITTLEEFYYQILCSLAYFIFHVPFALLLTYTFALSHICMHICGESYGIHTYMHLYSRSIVVLSLFRSSVRSLSRLFISYFVCLHVYMPSHINAICFQSVSLLIFLFLHFGDFSLSVETERYPILYSIVSFN